MFLTWLAEHPSGQGSGSNADKSAAKAAATAATQERHQREVIGLPARPGGEVLVFWAGCFSGASQENSECSTRVQEWGWGLFPGRGRRWRESRTNGWRISEHFQRELELILKDFTHAFASQPSVRREWLRDVLFLRRDNVLLTNCISSWIGC